MVNLFSNETEEVLEKGYGGGMRAGKGRRAEIRESSPDSLLCFKELSLVGHWSS